jgi:hypothetical protein
VVRLEALWRMRVKRWRSQLRSCAMEDQDHSRSCLWGQLLIVALLLVLDGITGSDKEFIPRRRTTVLDYFPYACSTQA